MTDPLVSCLIIASNHERYLERAVESALAQGIDALEVVIVDDGSTDGTAAIADSLAARDPRVRAIHQECAGWNTAFDRAVAEARGDLLAILDADCTWLPGKLHRQLELLDARPELGLVYSDLALVDEHDAVLEPSFWDARGVRPHSGRCAAELVTYGNTVGTSTIVVRAGLASAFSPLPADVPYADWWIGYRTACVAEIAFVREPLTGYRKHVGNAILDVQGDALVRELAKENQFRRIVLGGLEPGVLSVAETVRAYSALEASAHIVRSTAATDFPPFALPDPKGAEAELVLADAAEPLAALRHRVRAIGLDPWNERAQAAFVATAQALADRPDARETTGEDAWGFLALGFLDEIVDEPELLAEYARTFDGRADATLVVLAPGHDDALLGKAFAPVAEALGLDREGSADVVILTDPGAGDELAPRAHALYTRTHRNGTLGHLPQVGDADALRLLADAPGSGGSGAPAPVGDGFATIGFLDEILQAPDLLGDYARVFAGKEDATLFVLAPGQDDALLGEALAPVAQALGLDQEDGAEIVVLTDPEAGEQLADSVAALYTRVARNGHFKHLPQIGDAAQLLGLAGGGDAPESDFHGQALLEAAPPWGGEELPVETVPGMITDEEKRYFHWVGGSYSGEGALVELGPWLGCSTHHIVAGLEKSPAFAGQKLHVYDDFVWRSSWMDGYYDLPDRPDNHGDFQPIFDRYAAPVADRIVAEKRKFIDYDGNEALPQLVWNGGAIEIMYIDCGRTIEANEAWWRIFAPHFIPGKTLVIMQDWQLWKEQPPQWYNQTKDFTESKGDALELIHELRDGCIATFLYHGGAQADETPWAAEELPEETVPGMITDEEKRYFRWVGRGYSGEGALVELGPWLGCSTHHIVAGLEHAPAFEKLHVYDDFVWRSSWMDGYYEQADRPENHGDFKPIFDRYAQPIANRIVTEKVKFIDYDGNQALPQLVWNGGAIEIIYVDCGRTIEANEAWWRIFSPYFIPGKTLVIMQDWQLWKEQPPQWYNQTKDFTDSKGAALELIHELADGNVGTFLYHGEPEVAYVVEPAWARLIARRPQFHRWEGEPTSWNNMNPGILEPYLRPGMRTLETGAGYSSVVFAAAGCEHVAVTPEQVEADGIAAYCRESGYRVPEFRIGRSEDVLPTLGLELDAALIDGAHAFPHPIVDWLYIDRMLKMEGLLFLDDLQLMGVFLLDRYLARDWHWEELHREDNFAVYKKLGSYDHPYDHFGAQPVSLEPVTDARSFLAGIWPEALEQFGEQAPAPLPAVPAEPVADDRPNYLLVTFDSCRLDVLQEAHTPVLDSYAPIVAAQTPANFTYAAHQAFFVGMFPNAVEPLPFYNRFVNQLIGLGQVGEIQVVDKACAHRVGSDVNLVAGLRDAGYQTVGAGAMNWFKQRSLTAPFEKFAYTGTDADAQIAYLRREIDPSQPFFGFVNFGETHDPFDFEGKPDRCPIEVQSRLIEWPPAQNGVPVGRDSVAWEHQRRSAEFLDAKLPELFAGLPGNTIVILCGDHGEAFGEDGYWGHGVNHPSVLTVPLSIFRLDRKPL